MKDNYRITKKSISIMGGICFILFSLVTLFSSGTPFEFLSNTISHTFGFVGFWLLLPYFVILGFFLIFKKSFIKFKFGVTMWGCLIVIFCMLILCSHWASWRVVLNGVEITGFGHTPDGTAKFLTFSNALEVFDIVAKDAFAEFGPSTQLGGGKVGFIMAGALNSAITPIGLNIVCWILFVGGLIMVFNAQTVHFVSFIKNKKHKTEEFKEVNLTNEEVEPEMPEEVVIEENNIPDNEPFDNRPIFESFHANAPIHNDYDLKKAHFEIKVDEKIAEEKPFEDPEPTFTEEPQDFKEETPVVEEHVNTESIIEETPQVESVPETPVFEDPEPVREPEPEIQQEPVIEEEEIPYENRPQPKANLLKNYIFPTIDLLNLRDASNDASANEESCKNRIEIINQTFTNLGIGAEVVGYTVGPSVTRFDVKSNSDASATIIPKYITDISIRLNGVPVLFSAIVEGKSTSGLEIPNENRTNVSIREVIEELPKDKSHRLDVPFGKDISGTLKFANLAKFPHMLIAGTTGSGKSIFVHSVIITLLMRNSPDELKLVMVDPKKVEMNYYDDIPHLLCPVISDMRKVLVCFNKLVQEMERRYNLFQTNKVREIEVFNEKAKSEGIQPLPYIVVFIDEYADLVETVKEIKEPVTRLVQKARAAGIHLVFATQRPSVNVIDGTIKANVSTRVALSCASAIDSQTVIGTGGAEKLLGNGDMLIDCPLISRSTKPRAQGCFVSENEINRVCDFLREHYQPQFDPMFVNLEPVVEKKANDFKPEPIDKTKTDEEVYQRIKEDAYHREFFSISYITRTYSMGFSRAGKMFQRLIEEGVVEPTGDSKGSKVIGYVPGAQQMGTIEQSTFIPDDENND